MQSLFLAEVRVAGATLAFSALEALPHSPADVALVKRCAEAGGTPMHGAKVLSATLGLGAWKVVVVSGLALQDPNPVRNFPAVKAAWDERPSPGASAPILGAAIHLLAGLCDLDRPDGAAARGQQISVACERLARTADVAGRTADAYDLAMLGLSTGSSEALVRLPLARLALKVAEHGGGDRRKATSAVELTRALVATGEAAEALRVGRQAVRWLSETPLPSRRGLAQRLLDAAVAHPDLAPLAPELSIFAAADEQSDGGA